MSLKAFWEAVEQRLADCSADQLRAILRTMAQETLPAGRQAFLARLRPVEGAAMAAPPAIEQEELLADLDDLAQELESAMEDAGEWEGEYDEWGEYSEEDGLGPYGEFVEPLVGLFERAGAAFDYGNPTLARDAYSRLFDLVTTEDDYGRGVSASDLTGVDVGEAGARYLRAVYETEPATRRPQALWEQMQQVRSSLFGPPPTLEDLIQISPRPLPEREQFLADWIALLRTLSGHEADARLREAVRLAQGTAGLEVLAHSEGQTRPRAYLDWFTALEQEGKQREVLTAAWEALQALPDRLPIRAAIADHLCTAAGQLQEAEALRSGRWEGFAAKPTLSRLLDLWETAEVGTERAVLMQRAVEHMRGYLAHPTARPLDVRLDGDSLEAPAWVSPAALAHACMLAGDWDAAHRLAAQRKVLGWSNSENSQGLVVPAFLALLAGRAPGALPANLAQLWRLGLQNSVSSWYGREEQEGSVLTRLERAYAEQFAQVQWSAGWQEQALSWCLEVAQRRVDAIVGGKHRRSYDKAALLTVACAEVLRLRGDKGAADTLVSEVRDRFPRHRAFQSELETALRRMERGV
jgi:hypothetical protein